MSYMRYSKVSQVTLVRKYLFSLKWRNFMTGSRDITHNILKPIDEHALILKNNLH